LNLRVILVSNWPGLRIRALWRLARSRHKIVGVFIRRDSANAPLSNLLVKTVSRLPKGHVIAKHILSARQAERTALWRAAHLNKVRAYECTDINDRKTAKVVRELNPDVVLTMAWPKKFGPELLKLPRLGCINCHPSLLPKLRGRLPITAALLAGETETGVTFHLMNEDYDAGDILLQKVITIEPQENGVTLLKKCDRIVLDVLIELLDGISEGRVTPKPQDLESASETPRLSQADGLVDWKMTSMEIACRVRALYPWIKPYTFHRDQRIEFVLCEPKTGKSKAIPGQVLACDDKSILAATQDAGILIKSPVVAKFSKHRSQQYLKRQIKNGDLLKTTP
jgi:methionyl-tRNA formyltransferase